MQVAGMVTEFALEEVTDEGDPTEEHLGYLLDVMDSHLQGWIAWSYKGFDPEQLAQPPPFVAVCTGCSSGLFPGLPLDTSLSWPTAKALARTYAQAVQGDTQSMAFNMTTGRFILEFVADPSIDAPTEVYVNRELG